MPSLLVIVQSRRGTTTLCCAFIAVVIARGIIAQEKLKPLDPTKARTIYTFPIRSGAQPFRFQVQVDQTSTIAGVLVFRPGESNPFQTLPVCKGDLTMQLNEYDDQRELLKHADLNFDGFEDLKLLQYYVPHLGKSLYCIYTWSEQDGRFRAAPEIPRIDPIPHPQDKTITVHEDWQGGVYSDSIYRWNGTKLELAEQNGRVSGSDNPQCGFTDYCSQLIKGKMVITAERPSGCMDGPENQFVCPSTILKRSVAKKKSSRKSTN
jgi:hypothetical protein